MDKQNKVVSEEKMCEGCGDDGVHAQFHVIFTDGETADVCNNCIVEYFQEIPTELSKVEAIFDGGM